jgi:hypothetical protein
MVHPLPGNKSRREELKIQNLLDILTFTAHAAAE